ncbi:hypothetical protein VULLAG_LOCUS221 [Vulpes lagopus]
MAPKRKPTISSDSTEKKKLCALAVLGGKRVEVVCAKPCAGAVSGIRADFPRRTLVRGGLWEKICSLLLFVKEPCLNAMARSKRERINYTKASERVVTGFHSSLNC